ncbi:MAG: serpin family protein [Candidatus Aminicenantes bacterium]|nr:serpin family protein [Candidatus Aminicenantes bacterium]
MRKRKNIWSFLIILFLIGPFPIMITFEARGGEALSEQVTVKEKLKIEKISSEEEAMKSIVMANNSFGLALYRVLSLEKGNQFLSPLSLSTALAMTLEGARDDTAVAIRRVLNLPAEETVRQTGFIQIRKLINQPGRKSQLNLANAIWIQKNFPLLKNYLEIIAKVYDGQATNVDFINRQEETRKVINKWTEEKTAGKIKDLIPPGIIDYLTRIILTNAIYFRGLWLLPFNPELTKPEKFHLGEGQEIEVAMMRLVGDRARFPYMENEDLQMLEMFYEGRDLSMLILLPKKKDLTSLESKLTVDILETWKKQLKEERVDVYLPRFKMETKYFLKEKLEQMDMAVAFTIKADFSGINGRKDLFIQQVIHQALVEVNEEGTEAAAATGVLIGRTAYIPEKKYVFRADHPFIFLIQEKASGTILFLGRLSDPR